MALNVLIARISFPECRISLLFLFRNSDNALERFNYSEEVPERLSWCYVIHVFYRGTNKTLKTSFGSESGNDGALALNFYLSSKILGR